MKTDFISPFHQLLGGNIHFALKRAPFSSEHDMQTFRTKMNKDCQDNFELFNASTSCGNIYSFELIHIPERFTCLANHVEMFPGPISSCLFLSLCFLFIHRSSEKRCLFEEEKFSNLQRDNNAENTCKKTNLIAIPNYIKTLRFFDELLYSPNIFVVLQISSRRPFASHHLHLSTACILGCLSSIHVDPLCLVHSHLPLLRLLPRSKLHLLPPSDSLHIQQLFVTFYPIVQVHIQSKNLITNFFRKLKLGE